MGGVGGGLLRWGGAGKEALPFYIHKKLRGEVCHKKGASKLKLASLLFPSGAPLGSIISINIYINTYNRFVADPAVFLPLFPFSDS